MLKEWCIRHKYSVIFMAFLICFYGYNISRVYGFIFFPDEFGYWTYAAKAAGYDWSEIVSLGSYYSYGYSLILFPIFKLCEDSVMAYRVAVTLNFVLLGVVYFLLISMAEKLFHSNNKNKVALFAVISVFYPSWLFYAKTTMVEIVLMTMFVVISALLYHYLEKNKLSTLVLLVLAVVYIHFLHMRTIAVLIAGGVTLLFYFLLQSGKAKQFLLSIVIGIVVLAAGFAMKEVMQNLLYASAGEGLNVNDYAGQFEKVLYMFTKEGITNFLCGLAGKILYLGLASFGIAYWGMWYAVKEVGILFKQIQKKEKRDTRKLFFLFIILVTIGEILINTIFNIRPLRVDSLTYGRYHEFVLPVLMLLGLYEMSKTNRLVAGTGIIALAQLPMIPMVLYIINKYQLTNFHGYIMVGMSYLHNSEAFESNQFYWMTYVFGVVLTVLVVIVIKLAQRRGREDDSPFISIMQFMMRDKQIEMITAKKQIEEYTEAEMDKDDIVMLKFDSIYQEEMAKKYSNHLMNGHFIIYYNP